MLILGWFVIVLSFKMLSYPDLQLFVNIDLKEQNFVAWEWMKFG